MSGGSQEPSALSPENNAGREVDWLLTDADWVVVCDEEMQCIPLGAVAIDGGRIAAVGPSDRIKSALHGLREMDLSGHILLPGLVNTHTHAAMSCFRGLADDLPLGRWLHEAIFPAESRNVDPAFVYWGTLLSSLEMLKGGVTTFCDGYFFMEEAARAALDTGIRAVLGQGILDFPTPDLKDSAGAKDRAESFLASFPEKTGRLYPSLFCHAPYTCGAETLSWVKDLCRRHDILFQIHLSETANEVDGIIQKFGKRPALYLDSLGILDSKTLCAHAVWVDSREIEVLAYRNAAVSHAPESNMKLASGVAPIPSMLSAGIRVGIGTDGCASNNDLDVFSEMDRAAKLQKAMRGDPVICSAPVVLGMATRLGADAIGLGREVGTLEPGKKADLIAVDIRQPHLTPLYDPVSHLVYAVTAGDVRHVWVGGELLVHGGKIRTVNEAEVLRTVRSISQKVTESIPMGTAETKSRIPRKSEI